MEVMKESMGVQHNIRTMPTEDELCNHKTNDVHNALPRKHTGTSTRQTIWNNGSYPE
jgi:hypothetical protein